VVLKVDRPTADPWDAAEVIRRWQALFSSHPLATRFLGVNRC
jgi:hypothetical protein